ncbi:MAG: DUF1887 family protein [Clostridia bacterium]|nr:DUF1887 family protein [Clostridia bacterium]
MIYVEFFDRNPLENVCSCLAAMPEKVIMIGSEKKIMKKQQMRFKRILEGRGIETEFINMEADEENMQHQIEVLTSVVNAYDDCVFDLTGGDELSLVAAGIIYERYREQKKIRLQRVSIKTNMVLDCEIDGKSSKSPMPELSIEENILLYGGDVIYSSDGCANVTSVWEDSESFFKDVDRIWDVARQDPKAWSSHIGKMALAESHRDSQKSDELTTVLDTEKNKGIGFFVNFDILNQLTKNNLIAYEFKKGCFQIQYKNEQVKKCMSKEGMALEMKVYVTAKRLKQDGNPLYNDVMNGVVIDWDGNLTQMGNPYNEMDVCLMKGSIPIFISCKSGDVSLDELFKLSSVGEHFGSVYAKKILFANHLPVKKEARQHMINRAKDLGIFIVEKAHQLSEEAFCATVESLYKNQKNA